MNIIRINNTLVVTLNDGTQFKTETCTDDFMQDIKIQDSLREQLETYMNEHYPDYRDIHSYWD